MPRPIRSPHLVRLLVAIVATVALAATAACGDERRGASNRRTFGPGEAVVVRVVDGDTVRSYLGLSSDWFTFAVAPRQKGPARQ